jgi:hypothetical protein
MAYNMFKLSYLIVTEEDISTIIGALDGFYIGGRMRPDKFVAASTVIDWIMQDTFITREETIRFILNGLPNYYLGRSYIRRTFHYTLGNTYIKAQDKIRDETKREVLFMRLYQDKIQPTAIAVLKGLNKPVSRTVLAHLIQGHNSFVHDLPIRDISQALAMSTLAKVDNEDRPEKRQRAKYRNIE